MEKRSYVAFISYRHAKLDSTVAKTLHTLIEQFRIPKGICNDNKKRLGTVFRDHEELSLSSDLSEEICNALDHSEYLIVVCSKKTKESHWVYREIDYFLSHHDRAKVFAVIVDGDSKDVIPQSLTKVVNSEDGTVTFADPLAANISSTSILGMYKKLHIEKLRLFAAILNCPFDKLFMREQRRQRRQIIGAVSLILAVALSFSAMLLVKNHEISQKNLELAQQKTEVQLRESELLVQDAEEALAKGNTLSAVQNALAALPNSNNDRPYYAPAERTLISALGFFDSKSNQIVANTILEQNTPVLDFCISEDGTLLATVDSYGTATCFDTINGTVIWRVQKEKQYSNDNVQIFPVYALDSFIVFGNETIAYSMQTGNVLWTYDSVHGAVQSEDQSTFMFLGTELSIDYSHYLYYLVHLSAENGKILHKIPLAQGTMMDPTEDLPYISFPYKDYGTFSPNGNVFTSAYLEEQTSGKCILHYYIVDLVSGTIKSAYSTSVTANSTESNLYSLFFCDEGRSLAVIRGSTAGYILEKIDLQSAELLWTAQLTERDLYGTTIWHCFHNSKRIFIGCKNRLYVFDTNTGEQLISMNFEAELTLLEPLEESYYRFILADGTYGIGIGGLFFEQSTVLGRNQYVKVYEDGLFKIIQEDGYAKGIEATDKGYVATFSHENNHSVVIKRVLAPHPATQETLIGILEEGFISGLKVWSCGTDALVIGSSSSISNYRFDIIDSVTHQSRNTLYYPNDYIDSDKIWFLSDGSAYIECDKEGNITRYNSQTSSPEVLAEEERFMLFQYAGLEYYPSKSKSESVRLSNGQLLTVRCDEKQLQIWLDGIEQIPAELPEELIWLVHNKIDINHFLDVGGNGYAIISNFADNSDLQIDGFMVYDIIGGTWYPISTELVDTSIGFTCLGMNQPILGIADSSDQLFIFDIPTGELISQFSLQIPVNAVEEMHFIMEDTFMVMKTEDRQLLIFNVTSGKVVFREQLQDSVDGSLDVSIDSINHRLYIMFGNDGICLDMTSWSKLADIPGMLFYNPQNNQIYRYDYYGYNWDKSILVSYLPSTSELVEIAQKLVDEQSHNKA